MSSAAPHPFESPVDHLFAELDRLDLLLRRQIVRLRRANLLTEDEYRGLYIPDAHVDVVLSGGIREPEAGHEAAEEDALVRMAASLAEENAERAAATRAAGGRMPLAELAERAGLSRLEADAIVIALAPELDRGYETLYGYVQNDVTRRAPTVALVLDLLSDSRQERVAWGAAFAADAPLIREDLVRLEPGEHEQRPSRLSRALHLDDRMVEFLVGRNGIDPELGAVAELRDARVSLDDLILGDAQRRELARLATDPDLGEVAVELAGVAGSGRRSIAAAVARERGVPLLVGDLDSLPSPDPASIDRALSLLRREALLRGAALAVVCHRLLSDGGAEDRRARTAAVEGGLARVPGPLFLVSETRLPLEAGSIGRRRVLCELEPLSSALRADVWRRALEERGLPATRGAIEEVAETFVLPPGRIHGAARDADAGVREGRPLRAADLRRAARSGPSGALNRLAEPVAMPHRWDDIVLPAHTRRQLEEVRDAIRHRHRVREEWGFARRVAARSGMAALFAGPSGTGKTMAAGILGREVEVEVYRVRLEAVTSKYIGESEKNIAAVMEDARNANAALLFDEADAHFGKRSEVHDAHDRYANMETAFLLQQLESYDGIVILTTNLRGNIDEAFTRRLDHIVDFPEPNAELREAIWRGMFPSEAPLADDLDLAALAERFDLSGGNIRNAALAAAFAAASEGVPIGMSHVLHGVGRELQKLGRPLPPRELRERAMSLREAG